jgi:hypothetical protein
MTIYANGSSYSNSFSTLLRVTRRSLDGFDPLLTARDRTGADPLSRRLAEARIQLSQTEQDEESADSEESHSAYQQVKLPQSIGESSFMIERQSIDETEPTEVANEPTTRTIQESHEH